MTTDAAFKKQVRELAEREGIPYTEARTRLLAASREEQKTADHLPVSDVAVGDRPLDLSDDEPDDGLLTIRYLIQQTINDPRASRPYPWYLDEEGNVGHQSLWNGDPSAVIGFQKGEEQRVVLLWSDFVKNPQSALGLVPVMVDDNGGMAAWRGEITSVEVRDDDRMRA